MRPKKIIVSIPDNLLREADLKQAYLEMEEIHLSLAENAVLLDNAQMQDYEESLKELEEKWSLKEEISSMPT